MQSNHAKEFYLAAPGKAGECDLYRQVEGRQRMHVQSLRQESDLTYCS